MICVSRGLHGKTLYMYMWLKLSTHTTIHVHVCVTGLEWNLKITGMERLSTKGNCGQMCGYIVAWNENKLR